MGADQLTVSCFGVGDGWPCPDRNHSSFLYSLGPSAVLIDCGEPLSRTYLNSGLNCNQFDRLLLSHTHADHIGGLFMFLQGLWLRKRVKRLPIHLPEDAIEPLRNMLHACYLFPDLFHFKTEFQPLRVAEPVIVGPMKITPHPTTHLEMLRHAYQHKYPQSFAAFSFLIEANGKRVGHSADLGSPEDLGPLVADRLDLLVCELAHFKPKELFRFLKGRAIKKVVFVHVAQEYLENLAEIRSLAAEMLGKIKFSFARDGQELKV